MAVWLVEFSCATVAKSLKEGIAAWLVGFSCATVAKSLKEAVAGPTWVQSTIATTYGFYVLIFNK